MSGAAASQAFTVQLEKRNGIARIELSGELDLSSVPQFSDVVSQVTKDGVGGIVLDLSALDFIDSSGLKALIKAAAEASNRSKNFAVMGVGPQAERLFKITGTEAVLGLLDGQRLLDEFAAAALQDNWDV